MPSQAEIEAAAKALEGKVPSPEGTATAALTAAERVRDQEVQQQAVDIGLAHIREARTQPCRHGFVDQACEPETGQPWKEGIAKVAAAEERRRIIALIEEARTLNLPSRNDDELGLYVEGAIAALDIALTAIKGDTDE